MNTSPSTREQTPGERAWNLTFFFLSASTAASAMVDLSAGRFGSAIGELGATLLMFGLSVQFPFVRAFVSAGSEKADPEAQRQKILGIAEDLRVRHPWTEQTSRFGWSLLAGSLVLRLIGVE